MLSYLFKTNLASFRSAILEDNTDKICRILDVEREYLNKGIDSQGNTALHLAIEFASPLTVHLLLEQGAQPDQANAVTLQTPLSLLASKMFDDYQSSRAKKAVEMAKILLRHGAFVDKPSPRNYQDENNREYPGKETPLLTAVRKKNFPMAKLLVENKANVNYSEHHSKIRAWVHRLASSAREGRHPRSFQNSFRGEQRRRSDVRSVGQRRCSDQFECFVGQRKSFALVLLQSGERSTFVSLEEITREGMWRSRRELEQTNPVVRRREERYGSHLSNSTQSGSAYRSRRWTRLQSDRSRRTEQRMCDIIPLGQQTPTVQTEKRRNAATTTSSDDGSEQKQHQFSAGNVNVNISLGVTGAQSVCLSAASRR